jgi:hypothetical protein
MTYPTRLAIERIIALDRDLQRPDEASLHGPIVGAALLARTPNQLQPSPGQPRARRCFGSALE